MAFMDVLGITMMTAMIISPAVQAGVNMSKIRGEISGAQDNLNTLKSKWATVMTQEGELAGTIQTEISTLFTEIQNSTSNANIIHQEFRNQTKQIQLIGISLIFFIFILLLLKHYDLFDTIDSIILYPISFYKKYI